MKQLQDLNERMHTVYCKVALTTDELILDAWKFFNKFQIDIIAGRYLH